MRSTRTIKDYNAVEKIREWFKWSPYFFWQYGLSKRYFKSMMYIFLVIFSCFDKQNKVTRWLTKEV
jgi:hypothetical protein